MTFAAIFRHKSMKAALGGIFVALLGWQICWLPLGEFLTRFSFDLPFVFTEPGVPANVVLVELDEISNLDLRQAYGQTWDRRLHARLLDYLRNDGASLVVFDVIFTDSAPTADLELARAIRMHGRVVLSADVDNTRRNGIAGSRILPPTDVLRVATPNWGPTQAEADEDGVVRKMYRGTEQKPPLAWIAATLANATMLRTNADHFMERWVRYYGPGGTLPRVSYSQATNQPAGFYRGKSVFIGGRPKTGFVAEEKDEFLTPWRLHGQPQISGLELTATEFLNLSRGEFLRRLPLSAEFALLVVLGVAAGTSLAWVQPLRAVLYAVIGWGGVLTLAFGLVFTRNLWFNWSVAAFVQIPCALAWSLGWQWWHLKKEKDWLEAPLPDLWDDPSADQGSRPVPAPALASATAPAVPDHELLRLVGRGAYGDVWLARDVLGNFHAVKIIRRAAFDHADPYDREFRGLQKFTPISRMHPGLVQILHVGRNLAADYFYYVMEVGDDETTGAKIDLLTYTPRNLGRDLHRRAPLPPGECIEILAALCEALDFLHGQGLIHRDIKPANIIFVNGRPKLADIGLVTEIGRYHQHVSQVGTEGFLPPEGPGTVAGDLFALGKVLEQMLRPHSGALPAPSGAVRQKLGAILNQACAADPARRFASARAMREALLQATNTDEAR